MRCTHKLCTQLPVLIHVKHHGLEVGEGAFCGAPKAVYAVACALAQGMMQAISWDRRSPGLLVS